ncbi:MAG: hypothetical protein KAT70_02880 [Thermoplasmata archaeon]|nr:hypothetical protein [Thermoplasmata archaeon]
MDHVCKKENIDRKYKKSAWKKLRKLRDTSSEQMKYRLRWWTVRNEARLGVNTVAEVVDVTVRTNYRWLKRFRKYGLGELKELNRKPNTIHEIGEKTVEKILFLREKYRHDRERISIDS